LPRADVQSLDLPSISPTPSTEELLPAINPVSESHDKATVTFHSPLSTQDHDLMPEENPVGTLGFSMFPRVSTKTHPIDTSSIKSQRIPGHILSPGIFRILSVQRQLHGNAPRGDGQGQNGAILPKGAEQCHPVL
jgi:hypothetical protein